jgi:hypothetical protein
VPRHCSAAAQWPASAARSVARQRASPRPAGVTRLRSDPVRPARCALRGSPSQCGERGGSPTRLASANSSPTCPRARPVFAQRCCAASPSSSSSTPSLRLGLHMASVLAVCPRLARVPFGAAHALAVTAVRQNSVSPRVSSSLHSRVYVALVAAEMSFVYPGVLSVYFVRRSSNPVSKPVSVLVQLRVNGVLSEFRRRSSTPKRLPSTPRLPRLFPCAN